jgi:hypothetical protein
MDPSRTEQIPVQPNCPFHAKKLSFNPHTIRAGPFQLRRFSRNPANKFVYIEAAYWRTCAFFSGDFTSGRKCVSMFSSVNRWG